MARGHRHLSLLTVIDRLLNLAVALLLLVVAVIVLWHAGRDLLTSRQAYVTATTSA